MTFGLLGSEKDGEYNDIGFVEISEIFTLADDSVTAKT